MDYQLNLYAFVLLFAFLQGLFYVYQFCKRGFSEERVSDFWLAGLILALAFECGFNSKSTFNRAVKKATGQLPSTFGTKIQQ